MAELPQAEALPQIDTDIYRNIPTFYSTSVSVSHLGPDSQGTEFKPTDHCAIIYTGNGEGYYPNFRAKEGESDELIVQSALDAAEKEAAEERFNAQIALERGIVAHARRYAVGASVGGIMLGAAAYDFINTITNGQTDSNPETTRIAVDTGAGLVAGVILFAAFSPRVGSRINHYINRVIDATRRHHQIHLAAYPPTKNN